MKSIPSYDEEPYMTVGSIYIMKIFKHALFFTVLTSFPLRISTYCIATFFHYNVTLIPLITISYFNTSTSFDDYHVTISLSKLNRKH